MYIRVEIIFILKKKKITLDKSALVVSVPAVDTRPWPRDVLVLLYDGVDDVRGGRSTVEHKL